jgi:hypothetical protein
MRRVPPDPFFPPFDRDPLYVAEDDLPTTSRSRADGVPGPAIVLVIVGIPLVACAAFAVWWLVR